jgi:hypothetical protein
VIDEVAEIITLPSLEPCEVTITTVDTESVTLDEAVVRQLREYVQGIAGTYRDNPFHNYEHACHVQMSMMKLLQRVVMPEKFDSSVVGSDEHNYTYGITCCPLTQFTIVLCGLLVRVLLSFNNSICSRLSSNRISFTVCYLHTDVKA